MVFIYFSAEGRALVKQFKEEDQHFVETSVSKSAQKFLLQHNLIIIHGACGQGKTTLARHLCLNMVKNGNYFIQTDLDTLRYHCNPSKRQVILLEDFLEGTKETRPLPEDLQHTINYIWPILRRLTKSKYVYIVATTRSELLNLVKDSHNSDSQVALPDNEFNFDLNLKEYDVSEKMEIFGSICKKNKVEVPEVETEIIKDSKMALPLSFLLSSASRDSSVCRDRLASILYEGPTKWLLNLLDSLFQDNRSAYHSLVFLSFTGSSIVATNIELIDENQHYFLECFIDKENPINRNAAINKLFENLQKETKGLVCISGEKYQFIHRMVLETVAKHFGNKRACPFSSIPLHHIRDFYIFQTEEETSYTVYQTVLSAESRQISKHCIEKTIKECLSERLIDGIHSGELSNVFYIAKKFDKNFKFEEALCSFKKDDLYDFIPRRDHVQPWKTFSYWVAKLGYQNLLKKIKGISSHGILSFIHKSRPPVDPMSLFGAVEGQHNHVLRELIKLVSEKQIRCSGLNGKTAMHVAAERGNKTAAEILMKAKFNLDEMDDDGWTPINYASQAGSAEIVQMLKEKSEDFGKYDMLVNHFASMNGHFDVVEKYRDISYIETRCTFGFDTCTFAAISGNDKILDHVIKCAGKDILQTWGHTLHQPIHYAARYGNEAFLEKLIKHGSRNDVKARSHTKRQPIHYAARSGNETCIEILLEKGADIKETDATGNTVLHFAAPICSVEFFKFLIDKGAELWTKNKLGMEPIHYACTVGNTDTIGAMLDAGVDIHAKDSDGKTPLLYAAGNGHTATVEMLLKRKVSVMETDGSGHDALMYAASYNGHVECVELLIHNGADVMSTDAEGIGALQAAVTHGCVPTLNLLLENSADPLVTDSKNRQLLQFAASNGKTECLKLLINKDCPVNHQDNTGMQPIHYASSNGHEDCLRILLQKGASVKFRDNQGCEPLHFAASNGHTNCLQFLIESGADIRARDDNGREPIHYTASQGMVICMKQLIDHGANIEAADRDGKSPLHYAAANDQYMSAEHLLDAGANIHARDYVQMQPIHYAALQGLSDMVGMLLKHGASINALCGHSQPIHGAAVGGHLETLQVLLWRGADVEAKDKENWTPLMLAVKANALDCIENLLDHFNAKIDAKDTSGCEAIHIAGLYGSNACIKTLLVHKADIRAMTLDGSEPIHFASIAGDADRLLFFYKARANLNAKDHEGVTPIHLAATKGHLKCLEVLAENGAYVQEKNKKGLNALHYAASNGHKDCLEYLIDKEVDPLTTDVDGNTSVMFAGSTGHKDCLLLLVDRGADVKSTNKDGGDALFFAASNGHKDCLDILLANGAEATTSDRLGSTAILPAASQGHKLCMELLLQHGTDINSSNNDGLQAIHLSASNGHKDCLEIAVVKGANVNVADGQGATPIHYAASNGRKECLKYLLDHGADVNTVTKDGRSAIQFASARKHEGMSDNTIWASMRENLS